MGANHYEVIVIGVGSMGAVACWYLAKRNVRVLGLEQFDIPHEQGSHAGQSRIIRKAYFEHSDYVPLLDRAYHNWRELEKETGSQVFYNTGLLYLGSSHSRLMQGSLESAGKYQIRLDVLDRTEVQQRFPMVRAPGHFSVMFEPDAGFITPEKAISLYSCGAMQHGADIKGREKVISWRREGSGIAVVTNRSTYYAGKLVICAGAWAGKLMPSLNTVVNVTKQTVAWVRPKSWDDFVLGQFPCWLLNDEAGNIFYGFPSLPPQLFGGPIGLKLALHKPGAVVDPDTMERTIANEEEERLLAVLRQYFPEAAGNVLTLKTCLYTNSDDENFIIDYLPGYGDQVVFYSGCSGHGFKFASAIGEILSDLVIKGATDLPIEFLGLSRMHNVI